MQGDKEGNWIAVGEEEKERGLLARHTQAERSEFRGQVGRSGAAWIEAGRSWIDMYSTCTAVQTLVWGDAEHCCRGGRRGDLGG